MCSCAPCTRARRAKTRACLLRQERTDGWRTGTEANTPTLFCPQLRQLRVPRIASRTIVGRQVRSCSVPSSATVKHATSPEGSGSHTGPKACRSSPPIALQAGRRLRARRDPRTRARLSQPRTSRCGRSGAARAGRARRVSRRQQPKQKAASRDKLETLLVREASASHFVPTLHAFFV